MNEMLDKVSELVNQSQNIPDEIREIVKAICRGYIRESHGKIPMEGIMNVCNSTFHKISVTDEKFAGEERRFGTTQTDYDQDCNVIHHMSYVTDPNYIKLICILTHELGHVITEPKPNVINENGVYPLVKRTTTFYQNCEYQEDKLRAERGFEFRMADGFLETICTKIFASSEFRQELSQAGYDLQDYTYKDERMFPSRVYDEYKACFELFDYIMDGALFDFSCRTFRSNQELLDYINKYRLNVVFRCLDASNDALWNLKGYEGKDYDENFEKLFQDYLKKKDMSLKFVSVCLHFFGKSDEDPIFKKLFDNYSSTIHKQKTLPIPKSDLTDTPPHLS